MRSLTAIASAPGTSAQALMAAAEAVPVPVPVDDPVSVVRDGDEFVYVVAGRIDVDATLHTLNTGESIYYAGGVRHRWRTLDGTRAHLVVVQQNT